MKDKPILKLPYNKDYSRGCRVTVEVDGCVGMAYDPDSITLSECVSLFEQAAKGCGFNFDGHLDFMEEQMDTYSFGICDGCKKTAHLKMDGVKTVLVKYQNS